MELLLALILATAVTVALIPWLGRRAAALHVLDAPDRRKQHERPVPRVGGIAMAVGAGLALLVWLPLDRTAIAYLVASLVIVCFGVWDDRADLSPALKFLGQTIAVAIVVFGGEVSIHSITLVSRIELPGFVALPLTFLFLLGVTNAINLADGLDGLAGGTTMLCFAAIAALALGHGATFVLIVAVVVIGCLLGFLRFNSYPARVFMGDGGSQFLGFTVGVLSIALTQNPELAYSAALPLLLLGLPILDTLTVMALRIREGRSPFSADRRHMHHRLLAFGFDHFEAVVVIYLIQAALFMLAWTMRFESDVSIVLAFVVFAAVLLPVLFLAKRSAWRWQGIGGRRLTGAIGTRLPWLKAPERLPRWTAIVAAACAAGYLAGVAASTTTVGIDVAWLSLILALVLLAASTVAQPPAALAGLAHGAIYVAAVVAVYLDHVERHKAALFTAAKWLLLPTLALAVVLRLRLSRERRFEVTPLDVLVIIAAIAVPNLPGLSFAPSKLGLSVAKLVVLFYAFEMLAGHSGRMRGWLWRGGAAFLAVLAWRGLV